jgi:hypothetical protein
MRTGSIGRRMRCRADIAAATSSATSARVAHSQAGMAGDEAPARWGGETVETGGCGLSGTRAGGGGAGLGAGGGGAGLGAGDGGAGLGAGGGGAGLGAGGGTGGGEGSGAGRGDGGGEGSGAGRGDGGGGSGATTVIAIDDPTGTRLPASGD